MTDEFTAEQLAEWEHHEIDACACQQDYPCVTARFMATIAGLRSADEWITHTPNNESDPNWIVDLRGGRAIHKKIRALLAPKEAHND